MLPQWSTRRFLTRFQLLRGSAHFWEDSFKYSMVIAEIYLYITNLWPINFTRTRKVLFFVVVGTSFFHLITMLIYCRSHVTSIDTLAAMFAQMAVELQVMCKITVIFIKSNRIGNLINLVWNEFWPSNILGNKLEKKIVKTTKRVIIPIFLEIMMSVIYSSICLFLPMLLPRTTPILLQEAWYPLGWDRNFIIKVMNIYKSVVAVYTVTGMICSYDFLYIVLCVNCAAQFQLLCAAIQYIGIGKDKDIINKIPRDNNVDENPPSFCGENSEEAELLTICVKHHQKLIQFGNELNVIFGSGHFLQLCNTLMGICLTTYTITSASVSFIHVFLNVLYYAAHFWQLYVFCAASSYISDSSESVFNAAYHSKWYIKSYRNIRKYLTIVMIRSSTPTTMHAFGLFQLNYALFLTVMRFSFTLYTFLRTLAA